MFPFLLRAVRARHRRLAWRVLLINSDSEVKVGTPLVAGAKVVAEIVQAEAKGTKLHIYRWRRRKASRRKIGHRQKFTRVRITKIVA